MSGELTRKLEGLVPLDVEQEVFAVLEHEIEAKIKERFALLVPELTKRMDEIANRVMLERTFREPERGPTIREVAKIHNRLCLAYCRELDARGLRTTRGKTYVEAYADKKKRGLLVKEKYNYTHREC
jgi:hypothetical protein